ncbi:hypothetical protein CDAR_601501 [Caerostris darwini]|uniref:Uncharacterized protein n=1 Tax=Caerostris darwini TaxID=1538125 RepID=A0AAV4MZL7_9ARAC|nr:hypothetical protein CDAR_601501 [Caerostris darwini]
MELNSVLRTFEEVHLTKDVTSSLNSIELPSEGFVPLSLRVRKYCDESEGLIFLLGCYSEDNLASLGPMECRPPSCFGELMMVTDVSTLSCCVGKMDYGHEEPSIYRMVQTV